ncbi:MAG: NlpC/P60 family protein [Myxococcota bacterium]
MTRASILVLSLFLTGMSCGGPGNENGTAAEADENRPDSCPARAEAPRPLPGIEERHRTLAYWLERVGAVADLDEVLLSASEIADHNRGLEAPVAERPLGQTDLAAPVDEALLFEEVTERLAFMEERLRSGAYLTEDGDQVSGAALAAFSPPGSLGSIRPELRRAEGLVPVRCGPRVEGLYTESLDLNFDRNNCSTARRGEPVQLLRRWGTLWLARTRYSLGWVSADAPLSGALSAAEADGVLQQESRALTRRTALTKAFTLLDSPYGWGGQAGGRDCSRFVLDVFAHFGLGLPRHSGRQALAGTFSIDVGELDNPRDKALLIDSAAKRGLVLLSFPGHIMMYLGRTETGTPMAIHAFAEYLEPCDGITLDDGTPGEILRTVDRVTVSDLSLGANTSRTSFLERINRITVIGHAPGLELEGAASLRAPAPTSVPESDAVCEDSQATAVFRSPRVPHPGQPLRVIVTADDDPGPVELALTDPSGHRHTPEVRRIGGPPYTYWVEVESPPPGRWTAVFGDGTRVEACERFTVARNGPAGPDLSENVWRPRWRWENDTENLYAAFVEQLFDYPIDEDLTWNNLQSLLQDRDRNLLFNHLGQDEDEGLRLQPDCADLPYFLRAYFSWKTRLPFAFRRCSRGRAGQPPTCGDINTNLAERDGYDEGRVFANFARTVRDGVHSANPRTAPRDNRTDVYPIPMTRAALRPGTVFADPYGHLLVIADWIPQTATDYGILVGADAQPDGTIGRRRFWRGSFLFTTDTTDVGAGFQAWRPLEYERRGHTIRSVDNRELQHSREYVPYSEEQYEGTADDFYDRMGALINPRPLDPSAMQATLVDALDEAVRRRLNSVNNGIEFNESRNWARIEMPTGYAIFETSGAWEDFSTPARDLRLLISIDAVTQFADGVERLPSRFGIADGEASETAERLREELTEALSSRSFRYTRSDGTEKELTLLDVAERAEAFEMAYNPNDCVEIRWAAPEGSDEQASCRRRAPRDQQARMAQYREWFQNRRRPPR